MAVFTIDPDNIITAFPDAAPPAGNGMQIFASQKELATVGKKLGLAVESAKREDGERVYRVAVSGKEA